MGNMEIKSDGELLKNFVLELAAKLQNNKIHIDELQGTATVQGMKGGKIFSFYIEQRDFTNGTTNINDNFVCKSDRKKEIKRLYQSGLKQTEIARKLNISQSLVSKLLND